MRKTQDEGLVQDEGRAQGKGRAQDKEFDFCGAGDGTRTREYQLGKLGPYHLATPAT